MNCKARSVNVTVTLLPRRMSSTYISSTLINYHDVGEEAISGGGKRNSELRNLTATSHPHPDKRHVTHGTLRTIAWEFRTLVSAAIFELCSASQTGVCKTKNLSYIKSFVSSQNLYTIKNFKVK